MLLGRGKTFYLGPNVKHPVFTSQCLKYMCKVTTVGVWMKFGLP